MKRQHHCHQNAQVYGLDLNMSKAPKRPRKRNELTWQADVAGAQAPKPSTRKPRAATKHKADTIMDSAGAELPSGVIEGPEGNSVANALPDRGALLARHGSLVAEGTHNVSDGQSLHSRIRDEGEQPAQTVALADDYGPTEPSQGVASALPQPSEGSDIRANLGQQSTQHHLMAPDPKSDTGGDEERSSRIPDQTTSNQVSDVSGRVKVWTQVKMAHGVQINQQTNVRTNPIYILAAITLGIPALLSIPLIGLNPGVQEGTFTTLLGFLLLSTFVTAVVFEIKRLVDQPSDADHH